MIYFKRNRFSKFVAQKISYYLFKIFFYSKFQGKYFVITC